MNETPSSRSEADHELAAVYRSVPRDEPQPSLDEAIRAAARRAVGSRPRPAGTPFGGWRVPLSIAAVIVLSVSLVTLMREEAPELEQPSHLGTPPSAPQPQRIPAGPSVAAPEVERTPDIVARDARQDGGIGLKPPRPAAPPAVGLRSQSQPSAAESDSLKEIVPSKRDSAPPQLAKRAPADAYPGNDGPRGNVASATPERQSDEELRRRDSGFAPAPRPEAAAAPPPVAEAKSAMKSEAASEDSTREKTRALAQATRPAQKPAASAIAGAGYANLPPEKWLDQIEALRKQGRGDEAKASFAEFRRRYPEYPLPDGLKDLEKP